MLTALIATLGLCVALASTLAAVALDDATQRRTLAALRLWVADHAGGRVVVITRPDATDDDLSRAAAMLRAGRRHLTAGGL